MNLLIVYSLFITSASAEGTGYLMGRVTMPDQQTGIPGAEVELQKDVTGTDVGMAKVTTDAQGNFYITNLEANDESWGYRLVVKKGEWGQSVTQHFSVIEGTSTVVTVRIFPHISRMTVESDKAVINADDTSRANVVIRLYDIDGKPVPDNMNVVVSQDSYYPNPGKFIAGNQNGTELILPTSGGKVAVQYGDIPSDTLARNVKINAECVQSTGSGSTSLSINLVMPNMITGTVYDKTMQPVPYANVFLSRWDGVGKYTGYNSTENGNSTDGSGLADANGTYRFSVMPAGDYMVTANESAFSNSTKVQVIRGTYNMDIILPMSRGSIKGYVSDPDGTLVPGVKVTLFRVYEGKLTQMATAVSDAEGSFSFDDIWYGRYNLQASAGDETADLPLVLDSSKATAAMNLRKAYATPTLVPTPDVNATPSTNVTATPIVKPTTPANATGKTVTPKPPTPTPFPITPENLLKTYGISIGVIAIICAGMVVLAMRFMPPKQ
ncbi:carboxypeptidase-like regulatory domain-containing protein [Methanocella sp. MCL-LM]|uniref:carboxypeptidase-like regulatory domain-containing protein n=1 Tax=Methanocella sp. MCL-LM TaxID=3412035 RepID=UPI003C78890D